MIHARVSSVPESSDPDLIGSAEWNDTHVSSIRSIAADAAQLASDDCVEASGGASGITYTLLSPTDRAGRRVSIVKVDAAVGTVNAAGTINGDVLGYSLVNQWQYVELQVLADESGYLVVNEN